MHLKVCCIFKVKLCTNRCTKRGCSLPANVKQRIFEAFRADDYNAQNLVLAGMMILKEPDAHTPGSRKTVTIEYSLKVDGRPHPVCKITFLDTFKITKNRITTIVTKLQAGEPLRDKRGQNPKKKIEGEAKERIRQHINGFPTVESHYGRNNGQNLQKYLEPGLNLSKMYSLFIELCREGGEQEVEEWVYRDIFYNNFKLSFSQPKQDTCDQCDALSAQIATEINQLKKAELILKRDAHITTSN